MVEDQSAEPGFRLVPVLAVRDPAAAAALLRAQFGFERVAADRLQRRDQALVLIADRAAAGHGALDHLALKAVDCDRASRAVLARGGQVDTGVTPDGPREIDAFWGTGVRYQFFQGPEAARIELCARRGTVVAGLRGDVMPGGPEDAPEDALDEVLGGHDHLGLACRDIAASEAFYRSLGMVVAFEVTLGPGAAAVPVCFMRRGGFVLELYSPPEVRSGAVRAAPNGHWRGMRFEGAGRQGTLTGPDGEMVVQV